MIHIFLIRHGQTEGNVSQTLQGHTHGFLTEEGVKQAWGLRDKLSVEQIDYFFSSDLKRAYDTCRIVAEPHGKIIIASPLLRERDWGSLTGQYIPDIEDWETAEGVEPIDSILLRVGEFLSLLKKDYDGSRLLVAGHGVVNQAIEAIILGKPIDEIPIMNNAEVREFRCF